MTHQGGFGDAKRLATFLARHAPSASGQAVWRGGAIRLTIDSYLSTESPPLGFVTSVRSVVLRGGEVLTVRNRDGWHVLPGGRVEPGEAPEQTLLREVLEEAAVRIDRPVQLGFMHLHHLTHKPDAYAYPYPDFLWIVYVSRASAIEDDAKVPDDYEEEAVFRLPREARTLAFEHHGRDNGFLNGVP